MDLKEIFLGDLQGSVIVEIGMRTVLMFMLVLVFLRMSGKKGVRQLSIFEVAIIISLGSAAGDPMFNGDFAILPSLLVFAIILGVYRLMTFLASKYQRFESLLEGDPICVITEGRFVVLDESEHTFAKDEFSAELRVRNVEHIGQVRKGLLETNGQLSLLFYQDHEVKAGLPIWPALFDKRSIMITSKGDYACTHCGHVEHLESASHRCSRCTREEWVTALNSTRLG